MSNSEFSFRPLQPIKEGYLEQFLMGGGVIASAIETQLAELAGDDPRRVNLELMRDLATKYENCKLVGNVAEDGDPTTDWVLIPGEYNEAEYDNELHRSRTVFPVLSATVGVVNINPRLTNKHGQEINVPLAEAQSIQIQEGIGEKYSDGAVRVVDGTGNLYNCRAVLIKGTGLLEAAMKAAAVLER